MHNKTGQATLVVLLLSLLGLTVALATVSSSLKNIKQTSQTDSGSKALAGAESALEVGISKITPSGVYSPCALGEVDLHTFPGFDPTKNSPGNYSGSYSICTNSNRYITFPGLQLDDVAVVDGNRINRINGPQRSFSVGWQGANSAVEITALYKNSSGSFILDRYAVNSNGYSPGNNFASSVAGNSANTCVVTSGPGQCGDNSYATATTSCFNGIPMTKNSNSYDIQVLRVRRLYNGGSVIVCTKGPGNSASDLGAQIINVTGTATTLDNTTRRVQATQIPSGLSGIFDYAIFTEGALTK